MLQCEKSLQNKHKMKLGVWSYYKPCQHVQDGALTDSKSNEDCVSKLNYTITFFGLSTRDKNCWDKSMAEYHKKKENINQYTKGII